MPFTSGQISRRDVLATVDSAPVALLKRAGAIPMGVTNTPELCMWCESNNHLHGVTCNPYGLDRIPGGSSGGEGSILGGAGAVIGIGSDIGGSIRIPCFFNGVFGHKTTPGVVPMENHYPSPSGRQAEYCSGGPMCRYAEDLLPMLRVMAGPNAHLLSLDRKVDLKTLRFFTVPHDGGSVFTYPVSRELIDVQRKTPTPFSEMLGEPGQPVWPVWELLKWTVGKSEHTMAAIGLGLMEMARGTKPSAFIMQQKEKLQKEMDELLGTDGVFLYPSHPRVAPKHHHLLFRASDCAYTGVLNILGLPVTQCPLGLSREGLPMGLQVGAGKLQDRLTLEVALYLEKAFGGWRDPGAD
ncbi:Fatty-acid amide hydrolase 2-A [Liparis tanakae]|uniref:Fatty-acid amide hydrolase 2-A n=1 Tax=Liparis tanakae TaxID=230148 RepID=A0A4Z2I3H3_9TELE|nr:Fatty-acid amide hydrolase 2-A [Liparis tanakae]